MLNRRRFLSGLFKSAVTVGLLSRAPLLSAPVEMVKPGATFTPLTIADIAPTLQRIAEEGLRAQFEQSSALYEMFVNGPSSPVSGNGWRIPSYKHGG